MKNYIRPSVEVSKFDVADIITASGEAVNAADLVGTKYETIYNQYVAEVGEENANDVAAVFQW